LLRVGKGGLGHSHNKPVGGDFLCHVESPQEIRKVE